MLSRTRESILKFCNYSDPESQMALGSSILLVHFNMAYSAVLLVTHDTDLLDKGTGPLFYGMHQASSFASSELH